MGVTWRQRAKVHWLHEGDKNTKSFYQYASERKRRNRIKRIVMEDGRVLEEEGDMLGAVSNFYHDLFTSHAGYNMDELLRGVSPRVTDEMNAALLKEFTYDEIKQGLDGIGNLKAPGEDGMSALFYKSFWSTIGDDVVREVKTFLEGGPMPATWNDTVVVLIPKVQNPEKLKDLRPISLCNVVYKIASKVLSNRLKIILSSIISENQSAFVPGRLITDNVLIAYEMNHFMQNKRSGRDAYAALKLDMSKAYDRVEWSFMEKLMKKIGFHDRWVDMIMKCISTVTYRIKVNGALTDQIRPSRGLRQGDPLSPYLFLLCAEGFSSLINDAEARGGIQGVTICEGAPSITHLLFADDSLLLLKANDENATQLRHVLQIYEMCSGQKINKDKSSIVFSKNTRQDVRDRFMQILDLTQEAASAKYLGLPVYMGKSKSRLFAYLKERLWKRIQGWKEKLLSKAGKETLIKAVAQAIPSYAMSCFDLTKSLCDEMSRMVCRYWWSQQDKENKLHWVSWEDMCRRKDEGGLGYRDLHLFNLAMLARQGWRILQNPDSLCARLLVAKYGVDGSILNAKEGPGVSYSWRSILRGIEALQKGLIWRVGDGTQIRIWEDPWVQNAVTRRPITPRGQTLLTRVEELLDPVTGTWDELMVREVFWEEDVPQILATKTNPGHDDRIAWHFDRKGVFSVKSAYHVLDDEKQLKKRRQQGEGSANTGQAKKGAVW